MIEGRIKGKEMMTPRIMQIVDIAIALDVFYTLSNVRMD